MKRFVLSIDLSNAAFEEDPTPEIARLLRYAAQQVETGSLLPDAQIVPLRDINGNTVGKMIAND